MLGFRPGAGSRALGSPARPRPHRPRRPLGAWPRPRQTWRSVACVPTPDVRPPLSAHGHLTASGARGEEGAHRPPVSEWVMTGAVAPPGRCSPAAQGGPRAGGRDRRVLGGWGRFGLLAGRGPWLAGVPGRQGSQAGSGPPSSLVPSWGAPPSLRVRGAGPGRTPESTAVRKRLLLCSRQDALAERLEKVLICACEHRGASPYPAFLDLLQVNDPRQAAPSQPRGPGPFPCPPGGGARKDPAAGRGAEPRPACRRGRQA